MKITCAIEIAASPEAVFAWVDDPERAKAWMTEVGGTHIMNETPDRVGTTFVETLVEGGRELEMMGSITAYQPGKSISFHLASPIHTVDVTHSVTAIPAGARLRQEAEVRWKFPMSLVMLVMGTAAKRGILAQSNAELERLKALVEGETIGVRH